MSVMPATFLRNKNCLLYSVLKLNMIGFIKDLKGKNTLDCWSAIVCNTAGSQVEMVSSMLFIIKVCIMYLYNDKKLC